MSRTLLHSYYSFDRSENFRTFTTVSACLSMFKTLHEKIYSHALTRCQRDLKFVPRPPITEGFIQATKHNLPKSKRKQSQFVMVNLKTNQFRRNYFLGKINQQESATAHYTRFTGKRFVTGRIQRGQQQATSEKLRHSKSSMTVLA